MFVLFAVADVCFVFVLNAGLLHSFCWWLFLFVPVLFRLFSFVCFPARLRCLHRLLLSSDATVVFVGVSCGEPGGNEQMAHSQILVVIVFA